MRAGFARRICVGNRHHPVKPAIAPFAHRPTIISRDDVPKGIEMKLPRARRRNNRPRPRMPGIARAHQVTAEKHKVSGARHRLLQLANRLRRKRRPPVARANQRAIPQLDHAGILRSTERMRVEQLRLRTPAFAGVPGTHEHQVTIGIRMCDTRRAQGPPIRRSTKCHQQFAIASFDDGWKGRIKPRVFVNHNVLDLSYAARSIRRFCCAEEMSANKEQACAECRPPSPLHQRIDSPAFDSLSSSEEEKKSTSSALKLKVERCTFRNKRPPLLPPIRHSASRRRVGGGEGETNARPRHASQWMPRHKKIL